MSLPGCTALQQLYHLDKSSSNFDSQLNDILRGGEYVGCEKDLERHDLIWLIDYLDEVCRHVESLSLST